MVSEAPKRGHRRFDWRGRLLPRSILGITALLLAASIGAAFSGAIFYAFYQYRLDNNETAIDKYVQGFDKRLQTALKIIDNERDQARSAVKKDLEPLRQLAASGQTIDDLRKKVNDSVWLVDTRNEDGSPSAGSAFVVFADGDQSFFLTSFNTVRAASKKPGPGIQLHKGSDHLDATLVTWDDGRDLALVSVKRGNLKRLPWSTANPVIDPGDRLFAVAGVGSQGTSITQGLVSDISASGIQHDASLGIEFQGGPLVNANGEVVGVASRVYSPLGFQPDTVWYAPLIKSACDKVVRCPSDAGATAKGG
jgi:S1-C subfamily serine protease